MPALPDRIRSSAPGAEHASISRMAKAVGAGTCVHCLLSFDELTEDHVFPRSWYPDSTPGNVEKPWVPACWKCNQAYGRLEDDLKWRFGLCVDPVRAQASGIAETVLRSMDPAAARNQRDAASRQARRDKVLREVLPAEPGDERHVLPGFENPSNLKLYVAKRDLERVCEKVGRGLTYLHDGLLIGPEYDFEFFFDPTQGAKLDPLLDRFGRREERGPGILAVRAAPPEERTASVFYFEIWGTFRAWGAVRRRQGEE